MIERGRICWFETERTAVRRPVLVLQSDPFNRSSIPTVLVAPLAQNLALARSPGNVLLRAPSSGLPRDTVVVVSQVSTVERARLLETPVRVDEAAIGEVEEGLRLVLGL